VMPAMLSESERAKLLARAQKLKEAHLDDFSEEARERYDGKQATLFKYAGSDAALRKRLIDAGFAEVVQRGAATRPGILKIYPNGNAPAYVPRERKSRVEAARAARKASAPTLNPRDVIKFAKYLETRKESWRIQARKAVEEEFSDVASAVNRLGFDRVREYVKRAESVSGSDGWRRHLQDTFGAEIVEFFQEEIEADLGPRMA
jgi:hypothetical protein